MNTKEAIERVQTRFNKWALDEEDLTALQALGLVTIESEDERIRKHIIKILDGLAPCHWDGNEKAKCIAYLEKQKFISDSLKAAGINVRQDGSIERRTIPYLENQKEPINYRKLYEDIVKSEWFKNAYEGKSLGGDDEQKLTDKKIVNLIKGIIMGAKRGSTLKIGAKSANDCIAYLEKQKGAKPVEWSDEDEKALKRAINICESDFGENSETVKFLKSLPERFF